MSCPPILFIIFKRTDQTKRVFDAIRRAKPARLYIVSDGARVDVENESDLVLRCRELTEKIDWECIVSRLYRERNMGSAFSIPDAITWFFSNEERGIVLEDDCLPATTFFTYCETLLKKYENDNRVSWINGTNINFQCDEDESYQFTSYPNSWGWASWRRVWQSHDQTMSHWLSIRNKRHSPVNLHGFKNKLYWRTVFDWAAKFPNWDYRVVCSCMLAGGVACSPRINQVKNIGIGDEFAVHTRKEDKSLGELNTEEMQFPMRLQNTVSVNSALDRHLEKHLYKVSYKLIIKKMLFIKFPAIATYARKKMFS